MNAVAIVERDVHGLVAHHARCLACGWTSRIIDGTPDNPDRRVLAAAKRHGEKCTAPLVPAQPEDKDETCQPTR